MPEPKTKPTGASVTAFVNNVEPEQRRKDGKELLKIFKEATGKRPKMWGPSIIGYGSYQSPTGEWPMVGFSPRKAQMSLYIMTGFKKLAPLLEKLGTHKVSSGCCLYIKKLDDVHIPTLKKIITTCFNEMKKRYG